jgi:transcriptional regulator with XRE-family HTH domain
MTPKQVEAVLKRKGWSRRHLAAALDVDQSTVYRWMTGKTRVPLGRALQIKRLK